VNRGTLKNDYLIINLIFIGIIILIIVYSFIFSAEGRNHPLPSGSELITGEVSASSGLSRSFSEIVRFNFREAKHYNSYGIRIFSFFAIQLLLRIAAILMTLHVNMKQRQVLILTDAVLSVLLLVVLFRPFIAITVKQLV
jgi:uncharacterized membrane protein YhaH (DUF805 family)